MSGAWTGMALLSGSTIGRAARLRSRVSRYPCLRSCRNAWLPSPLSLLFLSRFPLLTSLGQFVPTPTPQPALPPARPHPIRPSGGTPGGGGAREGAGHPPT
jgi:hypothetical protein